MATFDAVEGDELAEMQLMLKYLTDATVDEVNRFEYKSMDVVAVCRRFMQLMKECQKDGVTFASVLAQCLAGGTLESLRRKAEKHGFIKLAKWDPKPTPNAITPARASIILAPFLFHYCEQVYGDQPRQHGLTKGNYFPAVHCVAELTSAEIINFGKEWSSLFNTKKKAKEVRAISDHQYLEFAKLQKALCVMQLEAPTGERLKVAAYLKRGFDAFKETRLQRRAELPGEELNMNLLVGPTGDVYKGGDPGVAGYSFYGRPSSGEGHLAGNYDWAGAAAL